MNIMRAAELIEIQLKEQIYEHQLWLMTETELQSQFGKTSINKIHQMDYFETTIQYLKHRIFHLSEFHKAINAAILNEDVDFLKEHIKSYKSD